MIHHDFPSTGAPAQRGSPSTLYVLGILFLGLSAWHAHAAEYFVTKEGSDASNGTSRQTAFLTIQKGVNALQPGDTLTIGRGEYAETVTRDRLGSMDARTTIRAELPGTVTLRGDVALPSSAFKKVDGYRFIYAADFDREIQAVNEADTLSVMRTHPVLSELEYTPGTSFYDARAKKLYISTSDLQPPDTHHYTVTVTEGDGLLLTSPRKVTIEGIAVTGYQNSKPTPRYPGKQVTWGLLLASARDCIIRDCVAYLNRSGIGVDSGNDRKDEIDNGWNVIEKCTAYGNKNINIIGYASNHDEIRDCVAYRAEGYGMRLYGAGIRGPAVMRNNLSWGNGTDMMIKGGAADKFALSENSITLGHLHSASLKNSIVGSLNQYNRNPGSDTIYGLFSPFGNQAMNQANRDQSFADPDNFDFRLQATSKYRGTGPEKSDRGPFPYQANVFHIAANGKDTNDGLSIKKSWQTLAHALKQLRPGDTLYLQEGVYEAGGELKITNAEGQRTSIRARGTSSVVIRGDIRVSASRGLEFERLNFRDAVSLENSRDVRFNNCRFAAAGTSLSASAVKQLKVTHAEFTGFKEAALKLDKCADVWLSGNLYDNRTALAVIIDAASAVRYSDYNSYASADQAWRIGGNKVPLDVLQGTQDKYSTVRTPEYEVENGVARLQNRGLFDAGGPLGTGTGYYRPNEAVVMHATKPELHSVSDTTANIEWWTSVPAETEVAWGETPDTTERITFNREATTVTDGFNTLSLHGLKPGRKYYFRLLSSKPLDEEVAQYTGSATFNDPPLVFETATAPAPARTLYVAPDGDDAKSGRDRSQAWRTVSHAADAARAGDTVIVTEGTYVDIVRVRATGTEGRPITFQAAPGEKVIFSGNERLLNNAFSVVEKRHIRLDGFYFKDFGSAGWKCVVDLRFSKHLQVTRCFFNGFGKGSVGTQVRVQACEDVTLRNCVVTRGFQGVVAQLGSSMLVENSVFVNNLIMHFCSSNGEPKTLQARNSIFVDNIPSKVQVSNFETGGFERYHFDNNAFYLRIPDAERKPFWFYGTGPGRMSVADYDRKIGSKNFVVRDPQFAISAGKEPVDRASGKKIAFLGDWIPREKLDFTDLFVTNPELTAAKIGLQPEAFQDFHFNKAR